MSKGKTNNEYYWKNKYKELHKLVHEGFQGGCYVCELVGEKNLELSKSLTVRDNLLKELTYKDRGRRRIGWHGDHDVTSMFKEHGVELHE